MGSLKDRAPRASFGNGFNLPRLVKIFPTDIYYARYAADSLPVLCKDRQFYYLYPGGEAINRVLKACVGVPKTGSSGCFGRNDFLLLSQIFIDFTSHIVAIFCDLYFIR